jgi:N-lysine methyltransferase SETD6
MALLVDDNMQSFYTWFKSHNGQLDTSSVDVIQFPASEGGRGAVALRDILVSLV